MATMDTVQNKDTRSTEKMSTGETFCDRSKDRTRDATDAIISKLASFKDDAFLTIAVQLEEDDELEEKTNINYDYDKNLNGKHIQNNFNNVNVVNGGLRQNNVTVLNGGLNQNNVITNNEVNNHVQKPSTSRNSPINVSNYDKTLLIDPLDIVSENLIGFVTMYTHVRQLPNLKEDTIQCRLQCYKYYYFCLSYHTVMENILQLRYDKSFIRSFLHRTIKKSKLNISYNNLEYLLKEMVSWTLQKYENVFNGQNNIEPFCNKFFNIHSTHSEQLPIITIQTNPQMPMGAKTSSDNSEKMPKRHCVHKKPAKKPSKTQQNKTARATCITTQRKSKFNSAAPKATSIFSQETCNIMQDNQKYNINDVSRDSGVSSPSSNPNQMISTSVQDQRQAYMPANVSFTASHSSTIIRNISPSANLSNVPGNASPSANFSNISRTTTPSANPSHIPRNASLAANLSNISGTATPPSNPSNMSGNTLPTQTYRSQHMTENILHSPSNRSYMPETESQNANIHMLENFVNNMPVENHQPVDTSYIIPNAMYVRPNIPYVPTKLMEHNLNLGQ